jgi:CBS domain-containing protein
METTMTDAWKARVEAATVRLSKLGGQGVLMPGGIVLTACHCIEWSGEAAMALGDHFLEPIVTRSGATFRMSPVAADPVADIAALMSADNQQFDEDGEAFDAWEETVQPIAPSFGFERWCPPGEFGATQEFAIHCWTHAGTWVAGRARRTIVGLSSPRAEMAFESPIRGGTSGGPIVDNEGRLVGVVSTTNEVDHGACDGLQPLALWALPAWVIARFRISNA